MQDFEDYVDEEVLDMDRDGDDDWGPENDLGLEADGGEYYMDRDDAFEDPYDPYDIEYDR